MHPFQKEITNITIWGTEKHFVTFFASHPLLDKKYKRTNQN